MTVTELLAKHDIALADTKPGRYYTTCPKCSKDRQKPGHKAAKCLGVTIEADGRVSWGCNHCPWTGPPKGSGERQELQSYVYRDAAAAPHFRKMRNAPGREPRFWLEQPDGRGGWKKGTKGVNTTLIYRLDEVKKAIAAGRIIACAEGEKDCDNLSALGITATCNAHGASEPGKKAKWTKVHSEQLAGADLVVLNDNDAAGYEHADATCKLSHGVAKRVRRLDLKTDWPEIPTKGGDVSDWLAVDGHTPGKLKALIEAAPDYAAGNKAEAEAAASGEAPPIDADAELERLARLSAWDFERSCVATAKVLGVSAGFLRPAVKNKRAELGLDGDDGKQGRAIELPEPTPWKTPVNGAELLDAVAKAIRRYIVLPDHARDAAALWTAHTYLLDRFMITPRLGITSPTRGCGKTTLLDVESQLVFRPLAAANCSPSSVFRVVQRFRPCLLIDEADSFLNNNEELRGVLNSGHRRGGAVLRNVGDDHEPRGFSTFAACAIALIGRLPGTLADRAVPIDLVRRKPDEAIEPFRFDRVDHLAVLARKLARWTKDNADAIAATEPEMPAGLYNRTADNWRGLLAIATIAGGDWLARGHKAALQSVGADVDEGSRLELLLGDIRSIAAAPKVTEITSNDLITRLCEIVPRPWTEISRGKPMTPNKLARLLKPLGITSEQIGEGRLAGYRLAHFGEAFERYLAPRGDFNLSISPNPITTGTSDLFATSHPKMPERLGNRRSPITTAF